MKFETSQTLLIQSLYLFINIKLSPRKSHVLLKFESAIFFNKCMFYVIYAW